jgi:hypothetical protein
MCVGKCIECKIGKKIKEETQDLDFEDIEDMEYEETHFDYDGNIVSEFSNRSMKKIILITMKSIYRIHPTLHKTTKCLSQHTKKKQLVMMKRFLSKMTVTKNVT